MEKGVIFADLEQFVIVPERPRLWDLKNPGWSVNKSKHNRFVITPNGYLLNIFTMMPILMIGIPSTFLGIELFGEPTIPVIIPIVLGIIGILLLLLCLLIRRSELCIDLDKGYVVWSSSIRCFGSMISTRLWAPRSGSRRIEMYTAAQHR